MDGDVVARAEDVFQIGDVVNGAGNLPCGAHGNERIVAVYVHAQLNGGVGNLGAYRAQADNAQLLALDLLAGELLLGLFGRLGDVLVVGIFTAPIDASQDVAAAQKKCAQDDLLNGVGIGARGVEHHDAFIGAAIERDVVHAGASAGNGAKTGRELHVVHGSAANKNALGFIQ